MHDVPAQVGKLLLIHTGGVAEHIPLAGGQQHILVHGVVHPVNGVLAVLHHVDVAEPGGRILLHEQRVEHKGVLAVVVQPARRQRRVVLAGIQHHAVAQLAVMQPQFAVLVRALIVPVHHHALVGGGLAVLVDVPGHVHHTGGVPCQLRILRGQPGGVLKAEVEQIRRVLNILHAGLPVEHEQVDTAHRNVAQPAARRRVPEDAGNASALLELAPPDIAVHLLVICLLQHHRQHAGKRLRCGLVVCRPGQHHGLGVVVHGVGVLVGNAVEQPSAGGLRLAGHQRVAVVFPVSHAEPQLVIDQALVQRRLARLVALQRLQRSRRLCCADGQGFCSCIFHNLSFLSCFFRCGRTAPAGAAPAGRPALAAPQKLRAG